MALKTLQNIVWKIAKWLVVLSVLYSACVFLGEENILPVRRILIRTSSIDLTALYLSCNVFSLVLTLAFLCRRLRGVKVGTISVLMTGACQVFFMGLAVFLLCQSALEYLFCSILRIKIEPVHPMVLKVSFFYLAVSMYCSLITMARLSGRSAAGITVASMIFLWTVAVTVMSWGFLYLSLHEHFMKKDTLVDMKEVDYTPLLVVSFLTFLVVDSGWSNGRNRNVVSIAWPTGGQ